MNKPKYITNKELLAEIHKSKKSFCYFIEKQYGDFDAIAPTLSDITTEYAETVLAQKNAKTRRDPNAVVKTSIDELVFRVMTHEHIPLCDDKKKRSRSLAGLGHLRTNFPPFKHYILVDGEPKEVGRSHWKNGLQNGEFCDDHGKITNRLAEMWMLLVERYSRRGNWRGYSYADEMRSTALLQLSQVGLVFDESKGDNPFAFYTTTIKNCLSGETEILTREYGSVKIADVSEQDVTLLDGNGQWVSCHIYNHGVQKTQLNYFCKGGHKEAIWSTANHGWVSDGKKILTKDFQGHDVVIDDLRPSKVVDNQENYHSGFTHGLVYGDGKYPKALPVYPSNDLDYLLGFFRGWFAVDGCVSDNGAPTLCGGVAEYDWCRKWGPLVGWHFDFGERKKDSVNMHLRCSSMSPDDFIIDKHHDQWISQYKTNQTAVTGWRVYNSRQPSNTRYEEVYCPVVNTTESFALACGIHSGNCFTRILNIERKNQNIRDDILTMAGAQPSYTRQIENDLGSKFADQGQAKPIIKRGRKAKVTTVVHSDDNGDHD